MEYNFLSTPMDHSVHMLFVKATIRSLAESHSFRNETKPSYVTQTAILAKPGHILRRKCPLVFPLMSYDCSIYVLPFIWQSCPQKTSRYCSCNFGLRTSGGKPEDVSFTKYDLFC